MTQQNKAREALEWFNSHYCKSECSHYETIRCALTILERLEAVDRVALMEAVSRLKKGYAQFDTFGTTYAVLYSENNENDLNLIEEAARIVLSLGENK